MHNNMANKFLAGGVLFSIISIGCYTFYPIKFLLFIQATSIVLLVGILVFVIEFMRFKKNEFRSVRLSFLPIIIYGLMNFGFFFITKQQITILCICFSVYLLSLGVSLKLYERKVGKKIEKPLFTPRWQ